MPRNSTCNNTAWQGAFDREEIAFLYIAESACNCIMKVHDIDCFLIPF